MEVGRLPVKEREAGVRQEVFEEMNIGDHSNVGIGLMGL